MKKFNQILKHRVKMSEDEIKEFNQWLHNFPAKKIIKKAFVKAYYSLMKESHYENIIHSYFEVKMFTYQTILTLPLIEIYGMDKEDPMIDEKLEDEEIARKLIEKMYFIQ